MAPQDPAYSEIERLVQRFKDMQRENLSTMVDAMREMGLETRSK